AVLCVSAIACSGASPAAPTTPATAAPSAPAAPQPPTCRIVNSPGVTALDSDVACLSISGSNETLDCQGHTINAAIDATGIASGVSILNCTMKGVNLPWNVTNMTIANSTINGAIAIAFGHNNAIRQDRFVGGVTGGALVTFAGGDHNQISDSSLDGNYHGQCSVCGFDDAILLWNESDDTVQGNAISNVWDAGIEGVDAVVDSTITSNTIDNALSAGIASYWCTHWQGNTIADNHVSDATTLVRFSYRTGPLCFGFGSAPSGLFSANTVAGNTLRDPTGFEVVLMSLDFQTNPAAADSNELQDNDVGSGGVLAQPAAAFINAGGNTCGTSGNFRC
ncbi:MAG: right-handed parallel beta-helix repeat-containing protein, partial [Vicinamibacterales bacterium]